MPPEDAVGEPSKIENGLEMPPVAPEAPKSNNVPSPAETSVLAPAPQNHPRSFLAKALESIQFRKRAKLEKIIKFTNEKHSVTNDQVEKLLHVSDATATRYLAQLVKEGRLRRVGHQAQPRYEAVGIATAPVDGQTGSIGGN